MAPPMAPAVSFWSICSQLKLPTMVHPMSQSLTNNNNDMLVLCDVILNWFKPERDSVEGSTKIMWML